MIPTVLPAMFVALLAVTPPPVSKDMIQTGSDIPSAWQSPTTAHDYISRDVMIPMRDGVKLHTVIAMPRDAQDLPILLERTPYDASSSIDQEQYRLRDAAWMGNREWIDDGYILVSQDVRGKYGSEGVYVMTRPPRGSLNPSQTDDTTDAYDTIEWLVKNTPQSNGRVGMVGSSYDGWTVAMALLDPHPALKVASPQSPMIDGWMGDDWFHYGAFRQMNFDYFSRQMTVKGKGKPVPREGSDDYAMFLDAGSAGDFAKAHGLDRLPWWTRMSAHPSYDAFWQQQALDTLLVKKPSNVPTMWIQGLWDQEDIYGAVHTWKALRANGVGKADYLVLGPWYHSQLTGKAENLGPLKWKGDTAADFRKNVLVPFFDSYLKDRKPVSPIAPVMIYDASENRWNKFSNWPSVSSDSLKPLYLQADRGLAFRPASPGEDSYVSDPAKPVPFLPPPMRFDDRARWSTWLVQDQRFVATRPDVLSYQTPVLDRPVRVEGEPLADIFLKTTGTDTDIVVKLIDVYPSTYVEQPDLAGYQLPISLDIFRGRYRASLSQPTPIPAGQVQEYKFQLPTVDYVFKPGHRIMVQIQSTLFPLYDRNPQTFVDNIFFAKPTDYRSATITIKHGADGPSSVRLPVVDASKALD